MRMRGNTQMTVRRHFSRYKTCPIHHTHSHPSRRSYTRLALPLRQFSTLSEPANSTSKSQTPLGNHQSNHQSNNESNSQSNNGSKKRKFRRRALLGASVVTLAGLTVFNLQNEESKAWQLGVMKSLPLNLLSRIWGNFHALTLPVFMRAPMYNLWTWMFGCDLSEIDQPLESFPNLGKFFVRPLRAGVRPIAESSLVSPVDALVTVIGSVGRDGMVEQIKGSNYKIEDFLGFVPPPLQSANQSSNQSEPTSLHYIVLYLAPGDYHRIHNPASTLYESRHHFPGHLFPVAPSVLRYVPNLFVRNERVVLSGEWRTEYEHSVTDANRFFSMTMVGAYNVGSVKLSYDEELVTNHKKHGRIAKWRAALRRRQTPHMDTTGEKEQTNDLTDTSDGSECYVKHYATRSTIDSGAVDVAESYKGAAVESHPELRGLRVPKGEEVARFELGSTVVLVFETKPNEKFEWRVKEGDKVKMGQPMGDVQ